MQAALFPRVRLYFMCIPRPLLPPETTETETSRKNLAGATIPSADTCHVRGNQKTRGARHENRSEVCYPSVPISHSLFLSAHRAPLTPPHWEGPPDLFACLLAQRMTPTGAAPEGTMPKRWVRWVSEATARFAPLRTLSNAFGRFANTKRTMRRKLPNP